MSGLFIFIYNAIRKNKIVAVAILVILLSVAGFFAYGIKFKESFYDVFPTGEKVEFYNEVLSNSEFLEKLILHVYIKDSSFSADEMTEVAATLYDTLETNYVPGMFSSLSGKVDDSFTKTAYDFIIGHLPVFMNEEAYQKLDTMLLYDNFDELMESNYKSLISPAGMVTKQFITKDPLSLVPGLLSVLKDVQIDTNFTAYNNFLVTKDLKHLLFFGMPQDAGDINNNKVFFSQLDEIIEQTEEQYDNKIGIEYYGSSAIAAENASRIQRDIQITVTIAIILLLVLFLLFFRQVKVIFLLFIPVIIGALIAIAFFALVKDGISAISIGIGSVLLGISVDYALHLFTHLKHSGSIKETVKDVAQPVIMSSLTTSAAFLCLLFISSNALKDLGLFAAISVIVAALVSLIIIPHFFRANLKKPEKKIKFTVIEKIAGYAYEKNKVLLYSIAAITVFLLFFVPRIDFEEDLEKSNYMSDQMKQADANIKAISAETDRSIFLMSYGKNLDEALQQYENHIDDLDVMKEDKVFKNYYSIHNLLPSTKLQQEKIDEWNEYWTEEKKNRFEGGLIASGKKFHFKEIAFSSFYDLLNNNWKPSTPSAFFDVFNDLISAFVIESDDKIIVSHLIKIEPGTDHADIYKHFDSEMNTEVLDKKFVAETLFNMLKDDFNKLIAVSLIIVFIILFLFFGRLELATMTFLPMLISWVWIVGIMGLAGIKFNIFNVIVSTFVFGLGIDYSIFIAKGHLKKINYGKDELVSYKSSVLLSSITTLLGIGVLIFAKHPALKSIAGVSIIGILSVVLVSFTVLPVLYNFIFYFKGKRRQTPITFFDSGVSIFAFVWFAVGSLILTIIIPLFLIFPAKSLVKKRAYSFLIYIATRTTVKILGVIAKRIHLNKHNMDFKKPSIIISNHQSVIDLLLFIAMSPRIIIMTKDWVWNNFFFGAVVRYAGYINIELGYDEMAAEIQNRLDNGYSVLVFPEGSRTRTGAIRRFHKGAFYLAEKIKADISPVLIHGAYEVLPSGYFQLKYSDITIKYLPRINTNDDSFGEDYSKRAKQICKYFRNEYDAIHKELGVDFYKDRLIKNFIFKEPVKENYIRVKVRMEKYYRIFHELVPEKAVVTDVGCGFGMLAYMLWLTDNDRKINGLDYDENKVTMARNCELMNPNLSFVTADALDYVYINSDVFIFSDMLHYMSADKQKKLVNRCAEKLNEGGKIIIRDGNKRLKKEHKKTKRSEFFSTNFGFNKTKEKLEFVDDNFFENLANELDLTFHIIDKEKIMSNQIYILSKK